MNPTQDMSISEELVIGGERPAFLPSLAPTAFITLEQNIVFFAKRLSDAFAGGVGYWKFHRLSNGGGFVSPAVGEGTLFVNNPMNYAQGDLSGEAFGICITLMALSNTWAENECDVIATAHAALTEYLHQHKDCAAIQKFLD